MLLMLSVRRDWPDPGFVDLLPGLLLAGPGKGFQLPVPADRALRRTGGPGGVGSG